MKMKWCVAGLLMLVLCASGLLHAQQSDANLVESVKAKAESGDANAQCQLAGYYYAGKVVPQDYAESVKWFRKATDQGNAEAQFNLGVCYNSGTGVTRDVGEAIKWWIKAAKQGLPNAEFNLACCYQQGIGVPTNYDEMIQWCSKAAEQGYAVAQNALGIWYEQGVGVKQDYVEAAKWYCKAAEQGNVEAQENYAEFLSAGKGAAQNHTEAFKWYRKSADQGDAIAQYNLGACFSDGKGVARDAAAAAKWYRLAADQDFAPAQSKLSFCYSQGDGVVEDAVEAVKWCRLAAEQGDATAQFNLGASYANGDGVPKNYVEAYKWDSLAASKGIVPAKNYLPLIEMRMKQEEVAEAQRLAAAFVPRKKTPSPNSNSSSPIIADSSIATGTGFFITDDGYLISNYHVVKDAAQIRLVTSAGFISAKVVQVNAANDLVLLKVDGRFASLPIISSRAVKLGGTVATVGFPNIGLQGFSPKLAKGEIASLSGAGDDARYFQISVPVQPGNSGGALVDEHGNVVGIVSAKLDASVALAASGALPENVNYAVKSSFLLSFLESVPAVSVKLKDPVTADRKFEDVVKSAQDAAVLVLVY